MMGSQLGSSTGLRHVAADRQVSQAEDCLYVAALSAVTSSGTVELSGSVMALNSSGVVGTFDALPLAIAVDNVTMTLFVSTPSSIEQLRIRRCVVRGLCDVCDVCDVRVCMRVRRVLTHTYTHTHRYSIEAELALGSKSCPCSFSTGNNGVIQ